MRWLHKALKVSEANNFKEAMVKEVREHTNKQHWIPFRKENVPPGTTVLPAVWSMKPKKLTVAKSINGKTDSILEVIR